MTGVQTCALPIWAMIRGKFYFSLRKSEGRWAIEDLTLITAPEEEEQ